MYLCMTTPKIETFRRGGARWYRNPITGGEYIGVTSVTGLTPKPWLGPWQAKLTAEFAVENIGSILQMTLDAEKAANPEAARKAVVDHIKGAPRRFTNVAADRGSDVHAHVELLAKGENPGRIHPDHKGYVDGFQRFLDKYQPEFLWIEQTVFSDEHGYAGTADALVKIDGETLIADWKTSKATYPEAAAQVCMYSRAQTAIELVDPAESLSSVTEPTIRQVPLPKIDGGFVLHLQPDHAEVVPLDLSDDVFDTCVALIQIHRWEADISKRVLGKPLDV